jgi:ATP-dependent helicase/nuclease subunit B
VRVTAQFVAALDAGRVVLVPHGELVAALVEAVSAAYRERGLRIWPTPRIRDFAGWVREAHLLRILEAGGGARCLSDIEERELWREIVEHSVHSRDFIEPGAAARAARRARRTLFEYGIPAQSLQADQSRESLAFLDWNQEFDERCRAGGWVSAAGLLTALEPPSEPVAYLDSPGWHPVARRWLERYGERLYAPSAPAGATRGLHAVDEAAELAACAHWAAQALERDPAFRAWIHVPELSARWSAVSDAFDAALAPQRYALRTDAAVARYAIGGGVPLQSYAPVQAALDLLDATLNSVSFERFSALLRSAELQDAPSGAGAAGALDAALRRMAPDEAPLATWFAVAARITSLRKLAAVPALGRLEAASRIAARLRGAQPLSAWAALWIEALEAGPWHRRAQWSSLEFQAAERLRELLRELAAAESFFGPLSRERAQRLLRRAACESPFQAQTGVPPIWVSGQQHDPWLPYEGVWILGCSNDRWPPPAAPVALLPVGLQREFGVVSAVPELEQRRARDLQARWAARGAQLTCSFADVEEGQRATPSPLLEGPVLEAHATTRPHWQAQCTAAPARERWRDESGPPLVGTELKRGIASLRAQSRCAFRGFAEGRLDAAVLEVPVPGFNDSERGMLIHGALEYFWEQVQDSTRLAQLAGAERAALLDTGIDRALAEVTRRYRDPGLRWRSRERRRMRRVLDEWLDLEAKRTPFSVQSIETSDVLTLAGLQFRVRIDRIDALEDGARLLMDYKTGAASKDWMGERPDNPQLPVYALLRPQELVAVAYGRVNAADPGAELESERANLFPGKRRTQLEGHPSMAALIDTWSARLGEIARQFADGCAEVAPTELACRSCRLQGFCRIPAALDDEVEDE